MIKAGHKNHFNSNTNECFEIGLRGGFDMLFANIQALESFLKIINNLKLPLNIITCHFLKKLSFGKRKSFLLPNVYFRHTKVSLLSTNNDKDIVLPHVPI